MSEPFGLIKEIETEHGVLKIFNPVRCNGEVNGIAQAILSGAKIWANKTIKDQSVLSALLDGKFTIVTKGKRAFEIYIQ